MFIYYYLGLSFLCEDGKVYPEKIMPFANTLSVPIALHSTRSAMSLLHTILLAYVITRQDRPGMWFTLSGNCSFFKLVRSMGYGFCRRTITSSDQQHRVLWCGPKENQDQ